MRKIIVLSFVTLDGVMQAPGGPEEDRSCQFEYGGWAAPFFDEEASRLMDEQLKPADYLLGRKTFEIFASYWPDHADTWPGIITGTKYVVSRTMKETDQLAGVLKNTVILRNIGDIKELKNSDGPNLQVHGSSVLIQLLLLNDLVDELWLKIFPLTLGKGKKLYGGGTIPASFRLTNSYLTKSGIIFADYIREGEIITGTIKG
ncbi:MAG TPA: dihydrofolate reductase family protein [Bacteroidales bacterium]|nr:dihydrofolate reductase family protein [Bacteroidales bacterium]